MKAYIPVYLDKVREIISDFEEETFTTADVLRKYSGGYYTNRGTLVEYSLNALFGRMLKENSNYLQIVEKEKNVSIKDDLGNPTKCSLWARIEE